MSVKLTIDLIRLQAPGWNRTGSRSIINLLDEGQKYLFSRACYETIFVDPLTGLPPILTTTDNILEYVIPDFTRSIGGTNRTLRAKKLIRVFIDSTRFHDYERRYLGPSFVFNRYRINPGTTQTDKLEFAPLPVQSREALENTKATITFMENPGTEADKYFTEFLIEPLTLDSETIPWTVPQDFEPAIRDYALGTIKSIEYGKTDERLNKWNNFWAPLFWDRMNTGAQQTDHLTPIRIA